MKKRKLLVFASGSKEGGGSGFEQLAKMARQGALCANIVGVVSNHADGGVARRAKNLGVPFFHFEKPHDAFGYQNLVNQTKAEFVALSGWLKKVSGLDPKTTFNIHPGPLPEFGGQRMFGHHVHEAVIAAYKGGQWPHRFSEVTMHFVTDEYDRGPICFRIAVDFDEADDAETLADKVNRIEHHYQYQVTDAILRGDISWDGEDPKSLRWTSNWNSFQDRRQSV